MIPKQLGNYEILAKVGAGGMGEVYRARDTRLDRDVALKLLPPSLAQEPERLARFEREAKLLASLNHPNIAAIHGLEQVGEHRFLVLEFVEGETLADRLSRGPLPLDEALAVCFEIATAVEAAHESGVVHRDLKPGNVMLSPEGAVKVLDFGLAKGGEGASAASDPQLAASPTITVAATLAGMILGTAAYMSPEQARGKRVDRRTDIWSFGCVLFECLSGRQAFDGETVSDVMARILEREPKWDSLPGVIPPRVRALLERCLVKDPRSRLRDIGEARIVLHEVRVSRTTGIGTQPAHQTADGAVGPPHDRDNAPARRRSLAVLPWILAAIGLGVAAGSMMMRRPGPAEPVTLSIVIPPEDLLDAGPENNLLAISPDGRSVVYAARRQGTIRLYLRSMDRKEPVELGGTEEGKSPFFSPDGEWVAFFAGLHLEKVSVRGGTPVDLAESQSAKGGTWLEDGTIVYTPTFDAPLFRVPAGGGAPSALTTLDSTKSERTHRWPCALPGSDWVVFTVGSKSSPGNYDDASIEAVSVRTGERRSLTTGSCARLAPGNRLIVSRAGSLYWLPLDPKNPVGGGTPVPFLDGVLGAPTSGATFFDIASNGTLVYISGKGSREETRLAWETLDGKVTAIPGPPRQYSTFRVSPDGVHAIAAIGPGQGAESDAWLLDLERGSINRLTFPEPGLHASADSPIWSRDGKRFFWTRPTRPSREQIATRRLDGMDSVRVVYESERPITLSDVDPSGRTVLYNEYGLAASDIWGVDVDGKTPPRRIVEAPFSQSSAMVSPDGRWLVYTSSESGQSQVMVVAYDRPSSRFQVSTSGGSKPLWSPDGHEIYFIESSTLLAAHVEVRGDVLLIDPPSRVFELPFVTGDSSIWDVDIHPSGSKFLVRMPSEQDQDRREITVVLGWRPQ